MSKPNLTVICDKPNNGYYNIMFLDEGMLITSECKTKDAYEGLMRGVAELLLDCAESYMAKENKDMGDGTELAKHIASLHHRFTETLGNQLAILSASRQLIKEGMHPEIAEEVAKAMNIFPGEWFGLGKAEEDVASED